MFLIDTHLLTCGRKKKEAQKEKKKKELSNRIQFIIKIIGLSQE